MPHDPNATKPKIIGVVLDNTLSFPLMLSRHVGKFKVETKFWNLSREAHWGKENNTILTTFKVIGRSNINYAALIWTPQLSDTSWTKLQTTQNSALRITTKL